MCFGKQMLYRYFHGHTVCQAASSSTKRRSPWKPGRVGSSGSLSRRCIFRHLNTSQTSRIHTSSGRRPRRCEQTACSRIGPFIRAQPPALEHQPQAHHTDAAALCPMRFRSRTDGDVKAPSWHRWMMDGSPSNSKQTGCPIAPSSHCALCSCAHHLTPLYLAEGQPMHLRTNTHPASSTRNPCLLFSR